MVDFFRGVKKKRIKKVQKVKKLQKKVENPKTGDKYELWAVYLLTISSIVIIGLMVKKGNSIKKLK